MRARIILPLLLPILGLLVLSGILMAERLRTVAAMQRVEALTALVTDTSALVHEVQRERGASSGFLGSKGTELREELTAQRARTDSRLAAFNARLQHLDIAASGTAGDALAGKLAAIDDIRRQVSALTITPETSFAYFTAANTHLLDMLGEAARDVEAPDVTRSVAVYLSLLQAKELAGQERAVGTQGFAAGQFDRARLRRLIMLEDQQDLYFRIVADTAIPAQATFMRQTITGDAVDAVMRMRRIAAEGGIEGRLDGITGTEWFRYATVRIDLLKQVEDRMTADLKSLAIGIRDTARTEFYRSAAVIMALLALTAIISTIMIRAIVRPLVSQISTMQHLAVGDTDVIVAGTERVGELGSMARAIAVFRDNAVEKQRLEAEQQAERARAEAVRIEAMASGGVQPGTPAAQPACAFDGWYDSVTDTETLALPSFQAIAALRRALYDSERKLLVAIRGGDMVSARCSYDELRQHCDSLLQGLQEFGRTYAATVTQARDAAA